jgi:hypothetical protein
MPVLLYRVLCAEQVYIGTFLQSSIGPNLGDPVRRTWAVSGLLAAGAARGGLADFIDFYFDVYS